MADTALRRGGPADCRRFERAGRADFAALQREVQRVSLATDEMVKRDAAAYRVTLRTGDRGMLTW